MNENKKQYASPDGEVEIDLRKVWAAFTAHWKLIMGIAIVCAFLGFFISNFIITPKYTSETIIMVLNKEQQSGTITNSDLTISSNLSNDFVNIATSRSTIEEVEARMDVEDAKIDAKIITNTRQIEIKVTHTNPKKAQEVADCVAEVASERICEIMDIPDMVRTVDRASFPESQSSPSVSKFTAIGFLLGLFLTWFIVAVVFLTNDKIVVSEDVEKYLDVPLLAVIPLYLTRDSGSTKSSGSTRKKKKKRS